MSKLQGFPLLFVEVCRDLQAVNRSFSAENHDCPSENLQTWCTDCQPILDENQCFPVLYKEDFVIFCPLLEYVWIACWSLQLFISPSSTIHICSTTFHNVVLNIYLELHFTKPTWKQEQVIFMDQSYPFSNSLHSLNLVNEVIAQYHLHQQVTKGKRLRRTTIFDIKQTLLLLPTALLFQW